MPTTLLASLGRSPGAVTGFYYAVQAQHPNIERLLLLRTDSGDVRKSGQVIRDELESQVSIEECAIAGNDLLLEDIPAFQKLVSQQIEFAGQKGHDVIMGITGGRTSMGAMMAMSAQLYAEVTHIYHMWVNSSIERDGDIEKFDQLTFQRRREVLKPSEGMSELISVPILFVRDELVKLRHQIRNEPTLLSDGTVNLQAMDDVLSLLPQRFTVDQARQFIGIMQNLQSGNPLHDDALLDLMGRAGISEFSRIWNKLRELEKRNGDSNVLMQRWIDYIDRDRPYWAHGLQSFWDVNKTDISVTATLAQVAIALLALYFQIVSL